MKDPLPQNTPPGEAGAPVEESPPKHGAPYGNTNALAHGAPLGNTNALKHGLYSRWFSRQEKERLDRDILGELLDEENTLKILIDRMLSSMNGKDINHETVVVTARTVALAVGRIESIHRSRKAIYDKQTALDKVWEELRYIPFEED